MHLAQLYSLMGLELSTKCKVLVCVLLGFAKSRQLSVFKKEGGEHWRAFKSSSKVFMNIK